MAVPRGVARDGSRPAGRWSVGPPRRGRGRGAVRVPAWRGAGGGPVRGEGIARSAAGDVERRRGVDAGPARFPDRPGCRVRRRGSGSPFRGVEDPWRLYARRRWSIRYRRDDARGAAGDRVGRGGGRGWTGRDPGQRQRIADAHPAGGADRSGAVGRGVDRSGAAGVAGHPRAPARPGRVLGLRARGRATAGG